MAASAPGKRTVVFLGASGGVGLAALVRALKAGHTCIALCRTPSKLTDRFPAGVYPNLRVEQGNAHDAAAVARCLAPLLPDTVVSSIGGVFQFSRMTLDDPHVCEKGMTALLQAMSEVRAQTQTPPGAAAAAAAQQQWRPRVVVVSTCGISKAGRDFPLATLPVYHFMLKVPHADKKLMERDLLAAAPEGGFTYTVVRPSLLNDDAKPERPVRVGLDGEPAVGYFISRDDTGRWIFENLLAEEEGAERRTYENKIVTITW
ncbi:hypothetical protein AAE478_002864 [Parahypoxylon ruwenzoriense]